MDPPRYGDSFFDEPDQLCAQLTFVVRDHAPLLANPRLARAVFGVVRSSAAVAPGRLWGALVLPETVRVIAGPDSLPALDEYITALKQRAANSLLSIVRRADDDTLDAVLRYSPVWGGAIYQVWQPGYHTQPLWNEYRLSNALYALARQPVEAGLARAVGEWPWLWLGGE